MGRAVESADRPLSEIVTLVIAALFLLSVWLLCNSRYAGDWVDDVHDFAGEEAEEYDFDTALNDYIKRKELGI